MSLGGTSNFPEFVSNLTQHPAGVVWTKTEDNKPLKSFQYHYFCPSICVSFLYKEACKTRHNPGSCFQCHFTLYNHKGFLVTRGQCPAENRSAHLSSYYSLSPGTAWGYTILPDRERRGRAGEEEKKDSSKTRGDKRDRERREVVTVRGRGKGGRCETDRERPNSQWS